MTLVVLNFAASVLSIGLSILGFVLFFRERITNRAYFVIGALVLAGAITYMYTDAQQKHHAVELQTLKTEALRSDAKVISDAIVISGWEDTGDYVGYLSQIAGFYRRHSDIYLVESETYARQLNDWQDYLKVARESGRTLYPSDAEGLKGLVKSGHDQLVQISSGKTPK